MYLAGFGGSLRGKMLRDAKSLKREALKPGGARAEVCVRLLNVESSSSQPEALDHWRAGEDIIVEITRGWLTGRLDQKGGNRASRPR